jgi:hypothetical protein
MVLIAILSIIPLKAYSDDSGKAVPVITTIFEGRWENVKNETRIWTFTGFNFLEYSELGEGTKDHYFKGYFTFETSSSPNRGLISFERTHASPDGDVWTESEMSETTSFEFKDSNTLKLISKEYRRRHVEGEKNIFTD